MSSQGVCRCAVTASLRRSLTLACPRCAKATSRRMRSTSPKSSTRCTCASVPPASSCSCRPTYLVRRSSLTTRYFSSYSDSWVAHAERSADSMVDRLGLTADSLVTEVASNDGYLLQHFLAQGIPVLGIEPAKNVAEAAQSLGIPTVVQFLGSTTGSDIAEHHGRADLVVANNVFAHVPDIRDFAAGLRELVKDSGLVTLEFPHLLRLIQRHQFDTIYHEH